MRFGRAFLVAVVVVACAVAAMVLWDRGRPGVRDRPEAVSEYLRAVSTGDEAALADIVEPGSVRDGNVDLAGIHGVRRKAPVVIREVTEVASLGGSYVATVVGSENGREFRTDLTLLEDDGRWFVAGEDPS